MNCKLLIFTFIVFLCCVSCVSAASNDTVVGIDSSDDSILASNNEQIVHLKSTLEDNKLSNQEFSYIDLNNTINNVDLDEVKLNGYYKYSQAIDGDLKNIEINRNITIDGCGNTTIDGAGIASVFSIKDNCSSFILKNITIKNAYTSDSGAVIHAQHSMKHVYLGGNFTNNRASGSGGCFYLENCSDSNITLNGNFDNNVAQFGGVLLVDSIFSSSDLSVGGNFTNNGASGNGSGGCFYLDNCSDSNITLNGDFDNNTALYGGVLLVDRIFSSSDLSVGGNFTNNKVTMSGGCFYFKNTIFDSNIALNGDFDNNIALYGGVLLVDRIFSSSDLSVGGNFTNNKVSLSGGCFYFNDVIFDSNISLNGDFDNNKGNFGGILFANRIFSSSDLSVGGNFTNNRASDSGGCFYFNNKAVDSNISLKGNFSDNSAATIGGVVGFDSDTVNVMLVGDFSNNHAPEGSVLSVRGVTNGLNIHNSTFDNNANNQNSAVISLGEAITNLTILDSNFISDDSVNSLKVKNVTDYDINGVCFVDSPILCEDGSLIIDKQSNPGVKILQYVNITANKPDNYKNKIIITVDKDNVTMVKFYMPGIVNTHVNIVNRTGEILLPNILAGNYIAYISFDETEQYRRTDLNFSFIVEYKNFTVLQNLIDNPINNMVALEYDYIYNEGDSVVLINGDNLIIKGNGFIIDAMNKSGIFNITGKNVTIVDLNLINSNSSAIIWSGDDGVIKNVNLSNNTSPDSIITSSGDNLTIDSVIISNSTGTAIKANGSNLTAVNIKLENNAGDGIVVNAENGAVVVDNINIINVNGTGVKINADNATVSSVSANGGKGVIVNASGDNIIVKNIKSIYHEGAVVVTSGNVSVENVTVIKYDIVIVAKNAKYVLTYGGKYTIALNPKLAGKTITFTLNGKVIGKGVSDANGVVSIQLSKSILGSAGNKKLVITFNGDDFYNSATTSVTISVSKESTKITAKSVKKIYNHKAKVKNIKIVLKNSKNKSLGKVKVTLKFRGNNAKKIKGKLAKKLKKGLTLKLKTNVKGIGYIKLKNKSVTFTKKGKYSFIVSYKGNTLYNGKTAKGVLRIK